MAEISTLVNGDLVFILPRGGELFPQVLTCADADTLARLEQCARDWPQENMDVLNAVQEELKLSPNTPFWLACETAFFYALPAPAASYALPAEFRGQYRKVGANGFFHQWVAEQFPAEERIVSVCLNETPNTAALVNRRVVDTSGGYSLLEGIFGRSTCGSIDPTIVLLLAEAGYSPADIDAILYRDSGWQAVVGTPCSLTDLISGNENLNSLACEMLTQQLLKAIGAMLASLGGTDRIVIGCENYESGKRITDLLQAQMSFFKMQISFLQYKHEEIVESIIRQNNGI